MPMCRQTPDNDVSDTDVTMQRAMLLSPSPSFTYRTNESMISL